MAKFNVPTRVTGPDEIEVKLVREDFYEISNIFRTCFEFGLSFTSAIAGAILSLDKVSNKFYLALVICGLATFVFLILTGQFKKKAKAKMEVK
ncbi:MAG: hypothetical protein V4549_12715 [Bacteroidota bacterium]